MLGSNAFFFKTKVAPPPVVEEEYPEMTRYDLSTKKITWGKIVPEGFTAKYVTHMNYYGNTAGREKLFANEIKWEEIVEIGANNFNGSNCPTRAGETTVPFNLLKLTKLGSNCFQGSQLEGTTLNIPELTTLGDNCFTGLNGINTIKADRLHSMGSNCFNGLARVTSIGTANFPSLERLNGSNSLSNLGSVYHITLKKLKYVKDATNLRVSPATGTFIYNFRIDSNSLNNLKAALPNIQNWHAGS